MSDVADYDREAKAITLGHPSYVWRFGQDRRLEWIRRYAGLTGLRMLDVGCGLGAYVRKLLLFSNDVYGVDIDPDKVAQAQEELANIYQAPAEELPFADGFFDVVLLHEVLEHVDDDLHAVAEAHRVLKPGGKMVIFVPNRWFPFETHGVYWKGQYHYGNMPLVNYLPMRLRNQLCPHVRVYTGRSLRRLLGGLGWRVVVHTQIFPGYDNIAYHHRLLARVIRAATYTLEGTPLRVFGLSHFLVAEKTGAPAHRAPTAGVV